MLVSMSLQAWYQELMLSILLGQMVLNQAPKIKVRMLWIVMRQQQEKRGQ